MIEMCQMNEICRESFKSENKKAKKVENMRHLVIGGQG